jgi:hypothetical protein
MYRSQRFHRSITVIGLVISLLTIGCKDDKIVLPNYNILYKGEYIRDPVFITKPINKIKLIGVLGWDEPLNTDFPIPMRPKEIDHYINIVPSLRQYQLFKSFPSDALNIGVQGKKSALIFNWNMNDIINKGSIDSTRIVVAIFKKTIEVSLLTNSISNKQDILWLSQSSNNKGSVNFLDGTLVEFDPISQKVLKTSQPKLEYLSPGIYVWCIWAYNEAGTSIVASSREIPFSITN